MDIDWKGIDRTHRALGGEGTTVLLLRTKERDLAVLEGALEGVSADSPAKGSWVSQRQGWCLLVQGIEAEIRTLVRTLAQGLAARGVEGTLTGASAAAPPKWSWGLQSHGSLCARFALRAESAYWPGKWSATSDAAGLAADVGTQWVSSIASRVMCHSDAINFWADADTARRMIKQQTLTDARGLITTWDQPRGEVRHAIVTGPCGLTLKTNRQERRWEDMVEDLRDVLLAVPVDDLATAGVTHRDWGTLLSFDSADSTYYDRLAYLQDPEKLGRGGTGTVRYPDPHEPSPREGPRPQQLENTPPGRPPRVGRGSRSPPVVRRTPTRPRDT